MRSPICGWFPIASDTLAFERIINVPKRGIGDSTIKTLFDTARATNQPLLAATRTLLETEELKPKMRTTLRDLIAQFDNWSERARTIPQAELAQQILDESGYTAMWQADKSPDSPGRLENLKELVNSMAEFETLGGFLEHIALVMDRDTPRRRTRCRS